MVTRESESRPELRDLRAAFEESAPTFPELVASAHAADVGELLEDLDDDECWALFHGFDKERRADVLEHAEGWLREQLVGRMTAADLALIVTDMAPDDVVDLLALADEEVAAEVLRSIDFESAGKLRELFTYDPDTAGGMMTPEFVTIPTRSRVGDAIKLIKQEGEEAEEGLGVFVVDEEGRPIGYLSDRDLLTHGIHETVDEAMEADVITVPADTDQEEAANQIQKYALAALGVVDRRGVLIGVVAPDDAVDVLEEEASEDMHRLVGTSDRHPTRLPVIVRIRHRMPMMLVTVLGGLATALILDRALGGDGAGTGAAHAADVLRYLPIIIGLAGNVGVQSSTILVRAFATGEVEPEREGQVLRSEVLVGFAIGVICGGATMGMASVLEGSGDPAFVFGSAVGIAILIAVTWASFLGCIIPMTCRRLGIDPAVVAGPFLITLSDVSGALFFVVIANAILKFGAQ